MKRKSRTDDVEYENRSTSRLKPNPSKIRNLKLDQIEDIKKATVITFIKKIQENPNYQVNMINLTNKCHPILKKMLNEYKKTSNENLNNTDFTILTEQSEDPFIKSMNNGINKLISYSGILKSLSSDDILQYRTNRPPLVSYKDHKLYFTEPLPGEYACMHNDNNSISSYCMAHKHHGITLKASPYYKRMPKLKFNPKTQKEEVVFVNSKGLCLYCERYLINHIFLLCKKKSIVCPFILNPYRYHVDSLGEYSKNYMLSQVTPGFYGVVHYFPKFKRDAFTSITYKKTINGNVYELRGLIEKDNCFFKQDTNV